MSDPDPTTAAKPLRLWPGVALVALQWLGWSAVPALLPDATFYGILGGLACGPALLIWWLFFSRAPRLERWGGAALVIAAMAVTPRFLHESVAKGNMGFQFYLNGIPVVSLAFVIWAAGSRGLAAASRRAALVAAVLLACGGFTLVRSEGVTGDGFPQLVWRWSPTAEERLLTRGEEPVAAPPPTEAIPVPEPEPPAAIAEGSAPPAEPALEPEMKPPPPTLAADAGPGPGWPGFRGPDREGVVGGVRIRTDWSVAAPVELWRRPVGPGVSSFAVGGGRLYTQEQRGEEEIVASYELDTGRPVWRHADPARFWDPHVGAGPRATPTLAGGRVYALGATGILNALDSSDGRVVWSRDAAADHDAPRPLWGYTSSPLVVGDLLIVHTGALAAYDLASGEPRWTGPPTGSYCSPQLVTLDGVPQVLLLTHAGVIGVDPQDGSLLWEHAWPGVGIVQPALTGEGDLLVSMIDAGAAPIGTRRLSVAHGPNGWSVEERWTSVRLKPSFSPLVVHRGHAYGFDGRFLACIDVADGERCWKGGRYGSGQLLLLPDQDLLLVVSEEGELAVVRAVPDGFSELARFEAIDGKTWNQPALVGDVLLVRNGEEMAAFRLPSAGG